MCVCVFEHSIVFMDKRLLGNTEKEQQMQLTHQRCVHERLLKWTVITYLVHP